MVPACDHECETRGALRAMNRSSPTGHQQSFIAFGSRCGCRGAISSFGHPPGLGRLVPLSRTSPLTLMAKRERARPYIVWLRGTPKLLSKRLRLHRHVRNAVLAMARTEEQYI